MDINILTMFAGNIRQRAWAAISNFCVQFSCKLQIEIFSTQWLLRYNFVISTYQKNKKKTLSFKLITKPCIQIGEVHADSYSLTLFSKMKLASLKLRNSIVISCSNVVELYFLNLQLCWFISCGRSSDIWDHYYNTHY